MVDLAALDTGGDVANGPKDLLDWDATGWRRQEEEVQRLRQRIFKVTQAGDKKRVRNLQKLMLRSRANALVSVRRYAGRAGHAFIGHRLYLPERWTKDPARCREAGVPTDVVFAGLARTGRRTPGRGRGRGRAVRVGRRRRRVRPVPGRAGLGHHPVPPVRAVRPLLPAAGPRPRRRRPGSGEAGR